MYILHTRTLTSIDNNSNTTITESANRDESKSACGYRHTEMVWQK